MLSKFLPALFGILLFHHAYCQEAGTGWPCYGGDAGGSRYSTLTEVNPQNVHQLKPAWAFRTHELERYAGTDALSKAAFEATPVLVGRTLFFSTPSSRVFAIDAETGTQKWVFDPQIDLKKDFSEIASRGVAAWPSPNDPEKARKPPRIFIGTIDGRLIALNASDGKPVAGFGANGTVNLRTGHGDDISMTSPPAIFEDLVITGSSIGDNQRSDYPHGTVRAFSAIDGREIWSWDPVAFDSSRRSGAANAWSVISIDEKRGLAFIPTSCPSPDYFGGNRPGTNENANAVVALDAGTGKVAWAFQVVHHDIWDYDIAAQPMLITIRRKNKYIDVVAVGTKMGHIFILDRQTGDPVFPVEERPVPASLIPEEKASPTQPFPVLPAPMGLQQISEEDGWGVTDEAKKVAQARIAKYRREGSFTPPSLQGSLVTPGNVGGIHWGGMCYDPANNTLFTNLNWIAALIRLIPREKIAEVEKSEEHLMRIETGMQRGSPYILKREYLFTAENDEFAMQTKPPWGTLNAVDLTSGASKWQVPLGFMMDTARYRDAKKWGSLNFGGAIVTAGQLVFVAATRDNYFRAFHAGTGKLLWEYLLPASAQATPMTYSVNGKQYVVIAAGGHGKFRTTQGDHVMAFALP